MSASIRDLGYEEFHVENSKIGISIFYKPSKFTLIDKQAILFQEINEDINIMNASVRTSADQDKNIEEFKRMHDSREYFIYVHLKLRNLGKYSSQRDFIFAESQINTMAKKPDKGENKYKIMQTMKYFSKLYEKKPNTPVIMAADFCT